MPDTEVLLVAFRWRRLVRALRRCYGLDSTLDAAERLAKYATTRNHGPSPALTFWRDDVRLAVAARHEG